MTDKLDAAITSTPAERRHPSASPQPPPAPHDALQVAPRDAPPAPSAPATAAAPPTVPATPREARGRGMIYAPLLLLIMLMTNRRDVMGDRVNSWKLNLLGWATTACIFAATVGLVITWFI